MKKNKEIYKKGSDVLLINPPDDFARYPYLGLCQIASVLRERGISIDILDSAALKLNLNDIVQYVVEEKPRVIGISIMSMMLRFCFNLIEALRSAYPEGLIVVGGAHIDADCKIMESMDVKYAFRGEAEYDFANFCESVLGRGSYSDPPGLIIKDGKELIAKPISIIEDLNHLPMPAYDLLPVGSYYTPSSKLTAMSYISSRGCPYNCAYCSKLQQKKYRNINVTKVVDHLEYLQKELGVKWVEFVDEIFTLKKDYIMDLCCEMEKRNLKIQWGMGTRLDRLDEDLLLAMKRTGLKKIGFGIESGVEKVRFSVNKCIDDQTIKEVLNLCYKHKITTMGSFILGLPGETEHDIQETISFANKLPLNYVNFNRLIPIPNSEIFNSLVNSGQIAEDVWSQFMHGRIQHPVSKPERISEQLMQKYYKRAWVATYTDVRKIWRNRHLINGPKHLLKSACGLMKLASPKRYIDK